MTPHFIRPVFALALGAAAVSAAAQDTAGVIQLTIKDHQFQPAEIHLPAGKPAVLEVANLDGQPEEFESKQLGVEKVIPAGKKGLIRLRPLKPGRYTFVGEYHEATAKGAIVAE